MNAGIGSSPAPEPTRPSAVVIVTYQQPPEPTLWARLGDDVDQLIVVDNSTKASVREDVTSLCRASSFPTRLLQNDRNLGIARALNLGVGLAEQAGCRTVYFLDGDAMVDPEFFRSVRLLYERLEGEGRSDVGAIAPIVTDAAPSLGAPKLSRPWTEVHSFITSGLFTRIRTIRDVGGFNERLFAEGVDADFSARLRASGRRLVRVNRVLVQQPFGQPIPTHGRWGRFIELCYGTFYYLDILAGRSNSLHTRPPQYSLERRTELVGSVRSRTPRPPGNGTAAGVSSFLALIGTLLVDSLALGDWKYLRLVFASPPARPSGPGPPS